MLCRIFFVFLLPLLFGAYPTVIMDSISSIEYHEYDYYEYIINNGYFENGDMLELDAEIPNDAEFFQIDFINDYEEYDQIPEDNSYSFRISCNFDFGTTFISLLKEKLTATEEELFKNLTMNYVDNLDMENYNNLLDKMDKFEEIVPLNSNPFRRGMHFGMRIYATYIDVHDYEIKRSKNKNSIIQFLNSSIKFHVKIIRIQGISLLDLPYLVKGNNGGYTNLEEINEYDEEYTNGEEFHNEL